MKITCWQPFWRIHRSCKAKLSWYRPIAVVSEVGPLLMTKEWEKFLKTLTTVNRATHARANWEVTCHSTTTMLAPSRGTALRQALASSPSTTVPAFLVPALQSMPRRQFSATAIRPSKLGRTPLSIPPGVELLVGEPLLKKDPTSYLKVYKRTVSVTGPLGSYWAPG